jgi:hypothetical protein
MEPTPGSATSEFSITKYIILVGGILEGLGVSLEAVDMFDGVAGNGPVGAVLVAVGAILQIAVALGYQKVRARVKLAAIMADAPVPSKP